MRSSVTFCLMCALIAAASLAAAQTLDEIVAANLEARGGEQAWMDVRTVKWNGTMRMVGGAAGALDVPFAVEFKRPGKIRLEFVMQGMTSVQSFDGETGWSIMPFLGKPDPEAMAGDQVKELESWAEFDGALVNYQEKGHQVELLGTEEVDGTPAFKLKVTRSNGDVDTLFLDEEYFVEFKTASKREVQGDEVEMITVLGDYKEVDGLLFAHSMEFSRPGSEARRVITIDSVEVGTEIPDGRFNMPERTTSGETAE